MSPGPELTAQAVADLVGGRLLGDGGVVLRAVAALDRAGPDTLAMAVSAQYAEALRTTRAGAVLVPPLLEGADGPVTRIIVARPQAALVLALRALYPPAPPPPGVDASARLGPGVVLGRGVSVGAFAVLGAGVRLGDGVIVGPGTVLEASVEVGDGSVLGARVVCGPGTRIGRRVVIKPGAVLGGQGFGYHSDADGHTRIPHVGGCIIEDDVEIGANSCVDRGSIDDTVVGRGTKIDNLVHVGHNVKLGERCLLMAGVGVAGSTRIGNDVILAGQAGVIDHLVIGDGVRVGAQSGVIGDVPGGTSVSGFPARDHRSFLRAQAALYRLAPLAGRLERLARSARDD